MTKHSPCKNIHEAKELLNTVKIGIQNSALAHIFPFEIIEVMATESDPFAKIMADREKIISATHTFLNQVASLEKVLDAAENNTEENLSYESVGKDFLEFQETYESQLNELHDLCEIMKKRILATLELAEKEISESSEGT